NEESSIRELYARLSEVMTGRYEPVEFVFVDDHSNDATAEILAELAGIDRRVVALRLKRNYGQTVALAAGFDYAAGEIIISMDGDLQHDPADIPRMLDAFEETESDIVSGWREKRVDNFLLRRLPSRVANWMMAKLSGVDIHDFGTTFKVYRRETIKDIRLYGELHRFIPALAAWNGARVTEVPIRNIVRPTGKSHYGISRTIRVFFDLLTIRFLLRYMTRPSHFFGPPGILASLGGSGILLFLLFEKIAFGTQLFQEHGPLLVLGMMLFLFGLQVLAVGLIGELLMRTHFEGREKPIYRSERIAGETRARAARQS
ncbi:MAG TPA: glycosyltransferase family 2 protein, partial [Candidatus Acidoferrales bacterium]|nr:glycosyltransferase family 2 protein [Candidatus Acidoferrales bacterium]